MLGKRRAYWGGRGLYAEGAYSQRNMVKVHFINLGSLTRFFSYSMFNQY